MKRFSFVFSVLFLLLCAVPLAAMAVLGPAEPSANQVLASAPSLTDRDGSFNTDYLSELSEYVDQRFGFRQELITLRAQMTAAVFQESATDSVVLGRNGWLFYSDTLADYQGTAPLSDRALWSAARTLALMQEQAEEQGADFLFVMAPNKNTLYPQYMPSRYTASDEPSNWERLKDQLDAQGVSYVDLVPVLAAEPEPVYYRTDSHWTPYGSALAHDAILAALGRDAALAAEPFTTGSHVGDLEEMLYPADPEPEASPEVDRERAFTHLDAFRSPEDMTIRTESTAAGSLLMFRDSFGNALYADMAESFARACFSRSMPVRMDLLDQEQPDTVIFELVERNLSWLATRAPVMAAPQREQPEGAAAADGAVALAVQQNTQLEGLVCYTGTLPQADTDSPVYVTLDGVCYEAAPAGAEEFGFTLYAPAAQSAAVYYRLDGQWLEAAGQF